MMVAVVLIAAVATVIGALAVFDTLTNR